ncbi:flavodoxin family protein [Aquimarina rhabdastrellae]
MSKGVIILGSSNSKGNTAKLVSYIKEHTSFDIIDLKEKEIQHFDYEFKNQDDFNTLFKEIVNQYDTIVFATPVYWYSMSGILKVFFDRISDFLYKEQDFGRKLRGKRTAMISCSGEQDIEASFYIPYNKSVEYLGMEAIGTVHGCVNDGALTKVTKERLEKLTIKLVAEKATVDSNKE